MKPTYKFLYRELELRSLLLVHLLQTVEGRDLGPKVVVLPRKAGKKINASVIRASLVIDGWVAPDVTSEYISEWWHSSPLDGRYTTLSYTKV